MRFSAMKKMKEVIAPWYTEEAGFFGERYLLDYEEIFSKTNLDAQLDFIEKVLKLKKGQKILDLPCGQGRHLIRLARRGYTATGQDLNGYFLKKAKETAKQEGVKIVLIKGDMRSIQAKVEYDVVLNLFSSFGYFENEQEDQKVLEQVNRALKSGGKLFLDTINREAFFKNFKPKEWLQHKNGSLTLFERTLDYLNGYSHETRTWVEANGSKLSHTIVLRNYTLCELHKMLQKAGLRIIATYGSYAGDEYNIDSKRLIIVAEKNKD